MSFGQQPPYASQAPAGDEASSTADSAGIWPPPGLASPSAQQQSGLPPRSRSGGTDVSEASSSHTWDASHHGAGPVAEPGGYLPGAAAGSWPIRPALGMHQRQTSSERSTSPGEASTGGPSSVSAANPDQQAETLRPPRKPKRSLSEASIERRKAQNRTAQKAFRERRERYVRDLEEKATVQGEEIRLLRLEVQRLQAMLPAHIQPPNPYAQPAPSAGHHAVSAGYWAAHQPAPSGRDPTAYPPASPGQGHYYSYSSSAAGGPAPPGPDYTSVHPSARPHDRSASAHPTFGATATGAVTGMPDYNDRYFASQHSSSSATPQVHSSSSNSHEQLPAVGARQLPPPQGPHEPR